MQVGESAALTSNKTTGDTNTTELSNNSYLNSNASAYKYHHNDEASRYTQAHGRHTFFVAGSGSPDADISFTEEVRIDSDGLKFNGDSAAANALNDYETGSFTPALSGYSSISYHRQKGQYTKIGRQVWMHIYFYVYQATGDSNVVTITGLPFTSSNADSGHIQNGGHIWYQNDTFESSFNSDGRPYLYIGSNSSYAQFRNQGGGDIYGNSTYLGTGANNRYIICGLQMIV